MSQASPDGSRATSYQGTDDLGRVTLTMSRMTEQLKTIAEGYSQEAYYLSVRDALKFFSDEDEGMDPIELEKTLPLDRNKQYNANPWTEIGNFFLQQCDLPTTGGWDALAGKVIYSTRSASNRKHQARSAVKTWLARRTDFFRTGKAEGYFSVERNRSDLESVSVPSHSEGTASSASMSQIHTAPSKTSHRLMEAESEELHTLLNKLISIKDRDSYVLTCSDLLRVLYPKYATPKLIHESMLEWWTQKSQYHTHRSRPLISSGDRLENWKDLGLWVLLERVEDKEELWSHAWREFAGYLLAANSSFRSREIELVVKNKTYLNEGVKSLVGNVAPATDLAKYESLLLPPSESDSHSPSSSMITEVAPSGTEVQTMTSIGNPMISRPQHSAVAAVVDQKQHRDDMKRDMGQPAADRFSSSTYDEDAWKRWWEETVSSSIPQAEETADAIHDSYIVSPTDSTAQHSETESVQPLSDGDIRDIRAIMDRLCGIEDRGPYILAVKQVLRALIEHQVDPKSLHKVMIDWWKTSQPDKKRARPVLMVANKLNEWLSLGTLMLPQDHSRAWSEKWTEIAAYALAGHGWPLRTIKRNVESKTCLKVAKKGYMDEVLSGTFLEKQNLQGSTDWGRVNSLSLSETADPSVTRLEEGAMDSDISYAERSDKFQSGNTGSYHDISPSSVIGEASTGKLPSQGSTD